MNIPAGYQIHIKSWENDGDSSKTIITSGLSKEDVSFYIDLAKLFYSNNSDDPGLGNSGVPNEILVNAVKSVIKNHPNISTKQHKIWIEKEGYDHDPLDDDSEAEVIYELIVEYILGYTETYFDEPNFCRVFESFYVFYIPVEIEDVTTEFMGV